MKLLKKISRAKVVSITPLYMRKRDVFIYLGITETLFRKLCKEYNLSVYGFGPKVKWYRKNELDAMMEELIVKNQTSATRKII